MKTLLQNMVKALEYMQLRLPGLSYHIEENKLYFKSLSVDQDFIALDFLFEVEITPAGKAIYKKTGFVSAYIYDSEEFLTLTEAMLRLANKHGLDIHFAADALDDVAALTPPFEEIPFRIYNLHPKNSQAVIAFKPESQINILRTFNRDKCLLALKLNDKYPLKSEVLSKVRARLSAFNTAYPDQLVLIP